MAGPSLCQQQNGHGAATAIAQRELSPGLPEGLTSHNLYWTSSVSWPAAVCLLFLSFSLHLLFTLSWSLNQLLCGVQDSHYTPSFDIRSPSISRSLYFSSTPFLASVFCMFHSSEVDCDCSVFQSCSWDPPCPDTSEMNGLVIRLQQSSVTSWSFESGVCSKETSTTHTWVFL